MAEQSQRTISYRIDGSDIITAVSPEWGFFAAENDTPQLATDAVLGQSLWSFIHGAETVRLYRLLFDTVRKHRRPAKLPFRCDSPTIRRFMEMELSSSNGRDLDVVCCLVRTETRDSIRLLDVTAPRSEEFLAVCSWCRRVRSDSGQWLEVEEALSSMRLLELATMPEMTHSICQQCRAGVFTAIGLEEPRDPPGSTA